MKEVKQFKISGNTLTLRVKKSPFIIRFILYFFTAISSVGPLLGFILRLFDGDQIKLYHILAMVVSGIIAYYFLRVSLWNSFGKEIITIDKNKIHYYADYKWFKGRTIEYERDELLEFGIATIGYEEDDIGTLTIGGNFPLLDCVSKMRKSQLRELIDEWNTKNISKE